MNAHGRETGKVGGRDWTSARMDEWMHMGKMVGRSVMKKGGKEAAMCGCTNM